MAWEPQQGGLVQLAGLLNDFQQPGSNQAQILQQLEQFSAVPDFNNYLAYIFAKAEQLAVEVRQGAGLLLKNNLKNQFAALPEQFRSYIKDALLWVLSHPLRPLRQTASTIASVIVMAAGLSSWPELVATMSKCMQSDDEVACDGAVSTLFKIIEEQPSQLEAPLPTEPGSAAASTTASTLLLGSLLKLMQSPGVAVRCQAVACLNLLVREMPVPLMNQFDAYLQGLFALAHDSAPTVRREVCMGLVQLLSIQPDRLQPFLYQIIEYMLASNEHSDQEVAVESCEFWMSFCDAELEPELLRPYLPRLIPLLMKNMVFDEYDEEVQDAEAAETVAGQQRPEKDSELKPFKTSNRAPSGEAGENGEEGGDDDDDDDEGVSRWNLRRCSASALDRLSLVYGDSLLPILLPIVEQRLQDPDWRARESAILALGAVAEGCHQGLQPYLEGMVSMLLPKLLDPRPMVRMISCWSLSRYSHWLFTAAEGQAAGAAAGACAVSGLGAVLQGVLLRVLDPNKFVQEAACSSVASIVEQSMNEGKTQLLQPFVNPMLEALGAAAVRYGRRNLRLLYDTLDQMMEALGPAMCQPQLVPVYLGPLFQRFAATDVQDKDILPLMDFFANVLPKLGEAALPYAPAMFDKSVRLATMQMELMQAAAAGGSPAKPQAQGQGQRGAAEFDRDGLVCALDLASSLAEALGAAVGPLVAASPLPAVCAKCCSSEQPAIRQSAFALVGDLAKACPAVLQPVAAEVMSLALLALDPNLMNPETLKSCNNACWALGEMAIKLQPEALQGGMAERIAERTAGVLMFRGRLTRSILENSAITLGRVAWMCPDQIAPHLAHFCAPWCSTLRSIRDDTEKEHAFLGLCAVVRLNPEPAAAAFPQLAVAVASWRQIKCEGLSNSMLLVLQGLKQSMSASGSWQQASSTLDAAVRTKLEQMYPL